MEAERKIFFNAFNTTVELSIWGEGAECEQLLASMKEDCHEYERLFSRTLLGSDIFRLNESEGGWVTIDPRTFDLLEKAIGYSKRSEGVFDVTIGPAIKLWDFKRGVVPDENALKRAMSHVDYRAIKLRIDSNGCCQACLTDPLAEVDLGGVAKGWIADKLMEGIRGNNKITGALLNLGGNIIVSGSKPDGSEWTIGVKDPQDPARNIASIPLRSGSVVTSGTYERSFKKDGKLYHHILNARTGRPVETDLVSATLICGNSMDAEGYSTTVLALGIEKGAEFVRAHPEIVHSCLVGTDGEVALM